MMSRLAIRWSGPVLTGGAVLLGLGIGMLALQPAMNGPFPQSAAAAPLGSSALLIVALPGMYAAQASASGLIGLVVP